MSRRKFTKAMFQVLQMMQCLHVQRADVNYDLVRKFRAFSGVNCVMRMWPFYLRLGSQ